MLRVVATEGLTGGVAPFSSGGPPFLPWYSTSALALPGRCPGRADTLVRHAGRRGRGRRAGVVGRQRRWIATGAR